MSILRTLLLTASAGSLLAQTEFLKPAGIAPANGYSHVVVTRPDKLIFIAGQVANNPKGEVVGKGDLKAQTEQVFQNLKTALAAAGASFDNVVKLNLYVKGYKEESRAVIREIRNKYINTTNPPASTLIGVAALALDDYLIEIEAVAAVVEKRR